MYFVNRPRLGFARALEAFVEPFFVFPVVVEIPHDRRGLGRGFPADGVRVALVEALAVVHGDVVLIHGALADVGDEALPDAALVPAGQQDVALRIPRIERTGDRHLSGVRCPYGEVGTLLTVAFGEVAAEFLIHPKMLARLKQGDIELRKERKSLDCLHDMTRVGW